MSRHIAFGCVDAWLWIGTEGAAHRERHRANVQRMRESRRRRYVERRAAWERERASDAIWAVYFYEIAFPHVPISRLTAF